MRKVSILILSSVLMTVLLGGCQDTTHGVENNGVENNGVETNGVETNGVDTYGEAVVIFDDETDEIKYPFIEALIFSPEVLAVKLSPSGVLPEPIVPKITLS